MPTPVNGNQMSTLEGCASVSDANGDLLFYTDGRTIYNTEPVPQPIYNTLKGDPSSSQSCIIVPDPANTSAYYIFTADGNSTYSTGSAELFNGVHIDVSTWGITDINSLASYTGSLIAANLDDSNLSPAEKVTAIPTDDCSVFWIVSIFQKSEDLTPKTANPGLMRIYKLDTSGLIFHQEVDMTTTSGYFFIRDIGYLKPSHDSQMLAISNIGVSSNNNSRVVLFPFDPTTGTVDFNNSRAIAGFRGTTYGLEFSPDNNYLYTTTLGTGRVFQIDLNVQGTLSPLGVSNREPHLGTYCHGFGALQLGPDEKIYIARPCRGFVGAINSPNLAGMACDVNPEEITLATGMRCEIGLPNIISNTCEDDCDCDCDDGCSGCNEDATVQNEALIERAKLKHNVIKANEDCPDPFLETCTLNAVGGNNTLNDLQPCFYFHWGDGKNDQIEEHDTEVFYLTACNNFNDIRFDGLRITKVTLIPDVHPLEKIHIVPDRFINLDCLEPCSCQTREFTMITRANDTAGDYTLQVEYCYEGISIIGGSYQGMAEFPLTITED